MLTTPIQVRQTFLSFDSESHYELTVVILYYAVSVDKDKSILSIELKWIPVKSPEVVSVL